MGSYKNSEKGKSLKAQEDGHTLAVRSGVTLFVPATQLATTYALQPLTLAPVMPALGWIGLGVGAAGVLVGAQASLPQSALWTHRFGGSFGPLLMIWVMFEAAKRLDKNAKSSDKRASLIPGIF